MAEATAERKDPRAGIAAPPGSCASGSAGFRQANRCCQYSNFHLRLSGTPKHGSLSFRTCGCDNQDFERRPPDMSDRPNPIPMAPPRSNGCGAQPREEEPRQFFLTPAVPPAHLPLPSGSRRRTSSRLRRAPIRRHRAGSPDPTGRVPKIPAGRASPQMHRKKSGR